MNCPICNSTERTLLTNKLRDGSTQNVWQCNSCTHGYLEHEHTEESLKKYYEEEYRKQHTPIIGKSSSPQELYDMYYSLQDDRIRALHPYTRLDKDLVEYGCSAGMFLWAIKDFVNTITGFDYDKESLEFTKKKTKCKILDLNAPKHYHIFCAFQVLEHIIDPHKWLAWVNSRVHKFGTLVIEVPNLYDPLISIWNNKTYEQFYYHKAHLHYFTSKSLSKLIESHGFKVKEVKFIQDYNLKNHLNWTLTNKPMSDPITGMKDNFKVKEPSLQNFLDNMNKEYMHYLSSVGKTSNILIIAEKVKVM